MSISENSRIAMDHAIQNTLGFLTGLGYAYAGVRSEETKAIGPFLEANYENRQVGRSIRVWYSPAGRAPNAVTCVFVGNGVDTFELKEYLRYKGAEPSRIQALKLSGDQLEHVAHVLSNAAVVLKADLFPIICGQEWEHVPVDWAGHK